MGEFVITSMLIQQGDRRLTRPLDDYLGQFDKLVATNLPIVLYLDRSLVGLVNAPNVTVVPTSIQDLAIWQHFAGKSLQLPSHRNEAKDTRDYLTIVNAKTELVLRTIAAHPEATRHAFVDFGLFHVILDTVLAQNRLLALAESPDLPISLPGIWTEPVSQSDSVAWRFCGGVFFGNMSEVAAFAELHQRTVREMAPRLTWEVNVWATMEAELGFRPRWLPAGHNDSILATPEISPAPRR